MATTTSPAIPANAMTPAAWDALNSDYATAYQNALKGGQTDATWAKSPEFLGFQNRTLEGVGNTYDTSKLQSDIASMSGGFNNPIYGDNFRKIVGAEQNRLSFLNGQNYSQSSDPTYRNPLIAALRANSPAPARQASGIKDISTGKIFNTPIGTGGTGTTGTGGTGTIGTGGTPVSKAPTPVTLAPKVPTPVAPVPKVPTPPPENNWINDPVIPQNYYVSPGPKSKTYQSDWDNLNAAYAEDYKKSQSAGVTPQEWANSPRFKAFQTEVINRAANTFDTDKLASDIAGMEQGFNDPIYGDNFRKIVAAEKARLEYLTRTNQGGPGQGEQPQPEPP